MKFKHTMPFLEMSLLAVREGMFVADLLPVNGADGSAPIREMSVKVECISVALGQAIP